MWFKRKIINIPHVVNKYLLFEHTYMHYAMFVILIQMLALRRKTTFHRHRRETQFIFSKHKTWIIISLKTVSNLWQTLHTTENMKLSREIAQQFFLLTSSKLLQAHIRIYLFSTFSQMKNLNNEKKTETETEMETFQVHRRSALCNAGGKMWMHLISWCLIQWIHCSKSHSDVRARGWCCVVETHLNWYSTSISVSLKRWRAFYVTFFWSMQQQINNAFLMLSEMWCQVKISESISMLNGNFSVKIEFPFQALILQCVTDKNK